MMHTRVIISFDLPKFSISQILLEICVSYCPSAPVQIKLAKNDLIYTRINREVLVWCLEMKQNSNDTKCNG